MARRKPRRGLAPEEAGLADRSERPTTHERFARTEGRKERQARALRSRLRRAGRVR
jgi:hypothetical protein